MWQCRDDPFPLSEPISRKNRKPRREAASKDQFFFPGISPKMLKEWFSSLQIFLFFSSNERACRW